MNDYKFEKYTLMLEFIYLEILNQLADNNWQYGKKYIVFR